MRPSLRLLHLNKRTFVARVPASEGMVYTSFMSSPYPSEPAWSTRQVYDYPPIAVVPPPRPKPRQRLWVHILLFVLTIFSTMGMGELLFHGQGWLFSVGILSILTCHEFGHYFTARYYKVPVSLPYFIPFPISLFGTLGAVIRMSPRIPNRRALFDIAAAGPLAGLVIAIPVSYQGISLSHVVRQDTLGPGGFSFGDPYLFHWLGTLAHGSLGSDMTILLHPLAFAGWAGMFVTALNLLPISQLDGGHISYAVFGHRSRFVARAVFGGLAVFSIVNATLHWIRHQPVNITYLPLLVLLLFFGLRHPPTTDDTLPLGRRRFLVGFILGITFIVCFSLVPVTMN